MSSLHNASFCYVFTTSGLAQASRYIWPWSETVSSNVKKYHPKMTKVDSIQDSQSFGFAVFIGRDAIGLPSFGNPKRA